MDLVTGGAGFIGSHLVEELVRQGRRVRVLDNFSTGRRTHLAAVLDQIELVEDDILDFATVKTAMKGVRRVFHQAALHLVAPSVDDPVKSNRVNVEGTLNVLMAARDEGVRRVVYASSSSVYGNGHILPLHEEQRVVPVSPYAISKMAGEQFCRVFKTLYGLSTVGLRYFNVFGPRQDPDSQCAAVIPRFLTAALRGESLEIHGDGLQSRDFTYVRNVVQANCLAAESDETVDGQVFNVACGQSYSLMDIVRLLGHMLEFGDHPLHRHHTAPRAGDVRHTLADLSKAQRLLGYKVLIGFAEGLYLSLQAMREGTVSLIQVGER